MSLEASLLERGYDAFNRRDVDALVELCDPEIRLTPYIAQLEGTTYEGFEGLRRYTEDAWTTLDAFVMELDDLRPYADEGWFIAHGTFRLRGHASDPQVMSNWTQLVRFRDGKLLEWRTFASDQDALASLESR